MINKTLFYFSNSGKMLLCAGMFLAVSMTSFAQDGSEGNSEKVEAGKIEDLPAKPFRMPSLSDVGGSSPFLSPDFRQGSVELGQGRVVKDVPLKFNTFNNAMMIIKNGQELKLDFFELVSYKESDGNGGTKTFTFKSGYPEVDGHNDNSIYQVLAMGPKLHLLKFISQKVEDVPTLGDYSRREIITTEQYYLYVPGGEIKRVKSLKSGKQALLESVPAMSDKITEIATAKKLRLKSEDEISILVEELNKP